MTLVIFESIKRKYSHMTEWLSLVTDKKFENVQITALKKYNKKNPHNLA